LKVTKSEAFRPPVGQHQRAQQDNSEGKYHHYCKGHDTTSRVPRQRHRGPNKEAAQYATNLLAAHSWANFHGEV